MSTPSTNLLDLSPRLIFDLASQMYPPHIVATEHGLDPTWLTEFMELPHVKRAIKDKKRELDDAGYSLVAKSRLMFEDGLGDVYRKMKDPNVSLSALVETMKFLRTTAQLDRPEASSGGSEKFSITINVNAAGNNPVTVDVKATQIQDDPLASLPSFLQTTNVHNDLEYVEQQ